MSPSEFELRTALHDGEGDRPDPDAVLAAGRARASARRTRLTAVAGTAAAVLAVGVGGAVVLHHDGGTAGPSSLSRAAAGGAAASDPDPGFSAASAPDAAAASATSAAGGTASGTAARCPAVFPTPVVSGGPGRLGPTGTLFAKPVSTLLVCGYGSTGMTEPPGTLVLRDARAQTLVTSLESAATRKPSVMCPDYRNADDHRFAFVGLTADGTALAPVTTTVGGGPSCSVRVTNGAVVRYNWSIPVALAATLNAVHPG